MFCEKTQMMKPDKVQHKGFRSCCPESTQPTTVHNSQQARDMAKKGKCRFRYDIYLQVTKRPHQKLEDANLLPYGTMSGHISEIIMLSKCNNFVHITCLLKYFSKALLNMIHGGHPTLPGQLSMVSAVHKIVSYSY